MEKLPPSEKASDLFATINNGDDWIDRLGQWMSGTESYSFIGQAGEDFKIDSKAAFVLYGKKKNLISTPNMGEQGAVDLKTGFNQIGLASIPAGFTAYDLLESLGSLKIKIVQKFSAEDQRYLTVNISSEGRITGSNFPIYPGDGLTIIMRLPVSGWKPGRL
ncbi:MAG: hypothetical protein AB1847_22875 [bacterium]